MYKPEISATQITVYYPGQLYQPNANQIPPGPPKGHLEDTQQVLGKWMRVLMSSGKTPGGGRKRQTSSQCQVDCPRGIYGIRVPVNLEITQRLRRTTPHSAY
eukprot:scaffold61578_cov19-Tisochrysis_lutea.AAC.1